MQNEKLSQYETFMKSIKGVILLASPSQGSRLSGPGNVVGTAAGALLKAPGSLQTVNVAHIRALNENSPELDKITRDFDEYCKWYTQNDKNKLKLKVHALRETKATPPAGLVSIEPFCVKSTRG